MYAGQPYAQKGSGRLKNERDGIYKSNLLLTTTKSGDGYTVTFPVALDLSDTKVGAPDSNQGGGPGGPGGPGQPPPGR